MENLLEKYKDDDTKKFEVLNDIKLKYQTSKRFYQDKRSTWEQYYKIYHKIRDDKDNTDEVDIKLSHPYSLVESLVSRIAQPALGKLTIQVNPKQNDHFQQAENFYNICRSFFTSAEYRVDFVNSVRERVICGSSWEFDEWANDYQDGTKWAASLSAQIVDMNIPVVSKAVSIARPIFFKDQKEVPNKFPINVGYKTIFPSIFSVYPQPNILKVKDLRWIIREVESIAVEDLAKAQYKDEKGELQPVYDLTALQEQIDRGTYIRPQNTEPMDYQGFRQEYEQMSQQKGDEIADKTNCVYLQIFTNERERIVVANGTWVIQHVKDLYHKPGLKCRIRVYTQNPHSIYGTGAIEPVQEELQMMDDFYNLGMQNQVRIVNRMIMYDEGAFQYPDDWLPRAGGRIRAKEGTNLVAAVMPVQQADTVPTIINVLGELKGIIESATSVSDFIPASMGSTPTHKTYGGLMEMQSSYAKRFSIIMLLEQCATMQQMEEMYWLFEQFMFDELKFNNYATGNKSAVSYKREDIDTGGEGFLFSASDDPAFGDTQIQRNQLLLLLTTSLNYVKVRASLNKTSWRDCQCDEIMEKVFEAFGKDDASKWLKADDGSVDPDKEYALMLQGVPVQVHPKENLTWHLIKHFMQKAKLESSQMNMPPQVISLLTNHISDTLANIQAVTTQPEQFAQQFAQDEGMAKLGRPMGNSSMNVGQSLPQTTGGR